MNHSHEKTILLLKRSLKNQIILLESIEYLYPYESKHKKRQKAIDTTKELLK